MRRRLLAVVVVLALLLAGGLLAARLSRTSARGVSPCGAIELPTWSPDGRSIAYVGYRWPMSSRAHRVAGQRLRAICVMSADGSNAHPLPHTTCSESCAQDLIDSPSQLSWVKPDLLVYGDDFRTFAIAVGARPKFLGEGASSSTSFETFSVDHAGDRLAAGVSSCPLCSGPVTVLDVPSGAVVGTIGGRKTDNIDPSISPDGHRLAFERDPSDDSGRTLGLWVARTDGQQLRRLDRHGSSPLWSPAGDEIEYSGTGDMRLVSPNGGASTRIGPKSAKALAWSPNGRMIAFMSAGLGVSVLDVATGRVSVVLRGVFPDGVAWSPDSMRLIVSAEEWPSRCLGKWIVSAAGGKSRLLGRRCPS